MKANELLKILSSLVYRLLILLLSVFILLTEKNNLSSLVYYFACTGYVVFIVIVFNSLIYKRDIYSSIARMVVDYSFITVVLFSKDMSNLNNMVLILLPVINSPNHTGEKRIALIPIFFLLLSLALLKTFSLEYLFGFVVLSIITAMESLRIFVVHFINSLYELLEEHFVQNISVNKLHRLYRDIIKRYNSHVKVFKKISSITCFNVSNNLIRIIHGSEFIWTYDLKLTEEETNRLFGENKTISNLKLVLNKKQFASTAIGIAMEGKKYVFCIAWSDQAILFFLEKYILKIFRSFFKRVAKLIALEENIKNERIKNFIKIKKQLEYVNRTTFAMHFLRNKFSPIKNYFAILESIESEKDEGSKTVLKKYSGLEQKRAVQAMKNILLRTNTILDKSQNPFLITKPELRKARLLYVLARDIWIDEFGDDWMDVKTLPENAEKDFVEIDLEALYWVIYELVSNISKYYYISKKFVFTYDEENIYLKFQNQIRNSNNAIDELQRIIDDFTEENKLSLRKNSYGLINVKSFLHQMQIKPQVELNNDSFEFVLAFERKSNESGNI